jgi:hypothetical protein
MYGIRVDLIRILQRVEEITKGSPDLRRLLSLKRALIRQCPKKKLILESLSSLRSSSALMPGTRQHLAAEHHAAPSAAALSTVSAPVDDGGAACPTRSKEDELFVENGRGERSVIDAGTDGKCCEVEFAVVGPGPADAGVGCDEGVLLQSEEVLSKLTARHHGTENFPAGADARTVDVPYIVKEQGTSSQVNIRALIFQSQLMGCLYHGV